jgi:hypothetical protein
MVSSRRWRPGARSDGRPIPAFGRRKASADAFIGAIHAALAARWRKASRGGGPSAIRRMNDATSNDRITH